MLRNKISGFTLIELMVVIVIIGVLASLAIPRFTEASAKAKVSEAPLVLKAYENGVLAAVVEQSGTALAALTFAEIVMDSPKDSKWWDYGATVNATTKKITADAYRAEAKGKMGKFPDKETLNTKYITAVANSEDGDCFYHDVGTPATNSNIAKQMAPMFMNSGCDDKGKAK